MNTGSYKAALWHRNISDEVSRLRSQVLMSWEKEARNLQWFGLQDGMSVLDVGSGPGFVTEKLLNMLPNSHITALEIDPELIEKSRSYLGDDFGTRLNFVEASVMNMDLPSNSFDFAIARTLFQHITEPIKAAKEIYRILKPGGKIVITDIDDAMFGIIDPPIKGFSSIMETYKLLQSSKGGNRLIGRKLWQFIKSVGFDNLDLEIVAAHSDDVGIEVFLPQFNPDRLISLVKSGFLSEDEYEENREYWNAFLKEEKKFVLLNLIMICGEKTV